MFNVFSIPKENSLISNQPLNCVSVLSPTIFSATPPVTKLRNASNAMQTLLYIVMTERGSTALLGDFRD